MNQIKIGKFIQEKRKAAGLTQSELAEKLNITDRAISKWENGICLPDVSVMPELCDILNISINDLFSGEKVTMKNNEKKLEENLLEMTRTKETKDKQLLNLEIIIGVIATLSFIALMSIAYYVKMNDNVRLLIIIINIITFIAICLTLIRIEQVAGYYECGKCHHKYVPTYLNVNIAPHIGRTRYMRCPKCNKKSWQKKVINKN